MDMYGVSAPDFFCIDDLLDLSNDEIFATDSSDRHHQQPSSEKTFVDGGHFDTPNEINSADFTGIICVPNDDVAELEWLSNFVDDSFSDFPPNSLTGTMNLRYDASFHGRSRSKRSTASSINTRWTSSSESETPAITNSKTNSNSTSNTRKREKSTSRDLSTSAKAAEIPRLCTHCASEKTPQWRTGPLGPKTLCNACGVRYKSGRLVPEYRPAASPTFVLTQHSNSHRKVMDLRRQKDLLRQQPQLQEQKMYGHHQHLRDFEVR